MPTQRCMVVILSDTTAALRRRRLQSSVTAFATAVHVRRLLINVADYRSVSDFSWPTTHRFGLDPDQPDRLPNARATRRYSQPDPLTDGRSAEAASRTAYAEQKRAAQVGKASVSLWTKRLDGARWSRSRGGGDVTVCGCHWLTGLPGAGETAGVLEDHSSAQLRLSLSLSPPHKMSTTTTKSEHSHFSAYSSEG